MTGTCAGIWVKPSVTTTYVVTQTLCGNVKKDTVTVEVWPVGVNSVNGQAQSYVVSPNPVDGTLHLNQTVMDALPVTITLYDAVGRVIMVKTMNFRERRATLNLFDITSGTYYMVIEDNRANRYPLSFMKL